MAPRVRHCRDLRQGMRGEDVIGYKRAISRAMPDSYKWAKFTDLYGPAFADAVKEFQKKNKLKADGVIGQRTHDALVQTHRAEHPKEWAFDNVAVVDIRNYCAQHDQTPEDKVRAGIVNAAWYYYTHRWEIAYSQHRPFPLVKVPRVPNATDCSGFATLCHFNGGAKNPNGRPYDGQGYTGTLMSRGVRVPSIGQLKPGDLIFYGFTTNPSPAFRYGDPTHVAVYIGLHNGVFAVISNGAHPMGLYPYNYTGVNHFRHYQVI